VSGTRARLAALLTEADPDLAEMALLIAAESRPGLDVDAQLARVDALAESARDLGGEADGVLVALRATGITGDLESYDDPRNSFLDLVLDRGRGLPITLSVLTVAVGTRAGVPMRGVGMPGHFVVGHGEDPDRFWDPFSGWAPLSRHDCGRIVRRITGRGLEPDDLRTASPRAIAARMLANLRASYLRRRDVSRALWTAEVGLLVDPGSVSLARELPAYLAGAGRYRDAEAAAVAYLADHPDAPDRAEVEDLIGAVRELQGRMN
jgi:regulator of sirC expression with transglutaminase-like and TPR domain